MILFYFFEVIVFKSLITEFGEPWMIWAAIGVAILMLLFSELGEANASTRR